jgi:hypothetical protein
MMNEKSFDLNEASDGMDTPARSIVDMLSSMTQLPRRESHSMPPAQTPLQVHDRSTPSSRPHTLATALSAKFPSPPELSRRALTTPGNELWTARMCSRPCIFSMTSPSAWSHSLDATLQQQRTLSADHSHLPHAQPRMQRLAGRLPAKQPAGLLLARRGIRTRCSHRLGMLPYGSA